MTDPNTYDLDNLIDMLNVIRIEGHGEINTPKVYLTLALEIKKLKEQLKKHE
jgi:hypothetical protein